MQPRSHVRRRGHPDRDALDEPLHHIALEFVGPQLLLLIGIRRNPISTSTAGMFAPTSTRKGAWIARGLAGTRSRSEFVDGLRKNAADSSM